MEICDRKSCIGCGACSAVCPQSAVVMQEDCAGFLYPRVDKKKCVKCGLCIKRCPTNVGCTPARITDPLCFGGAAKSEYEVRTSTSGGVASVLSRWIIESGGVVVGAAFDPFPRVRHICVGSVDGIARLKGSKYVESDITLVLPRIREYLRVGRRVLFVGLPCQVSAVYGFLGGDMKGLYTVDLICHGKPPQKLFSHWTKKLERMLGGKVSEYKFRDKQSCDWNNPDTYLNFYRLTDGRFGRVPSKMNWYSRYFLGSSSFRKCCYNCQFGKLPRVGDVTLADFWGAEHDERFNRFAKQGLSLVTTQSEKGVELVAGSNQWLDIVPCSVEFALSCNGGLNRRPYRVIYRWFLYGFVYLPDPVRKLCDLILFGGGRFVRRILRAKR